MTEKVERLERHATYEMQIFPPRGKAEPEPIFAVGDVFVVDEVIGGVTDMHWGKCTVVKLRTARLGEFARINKPTIRPTFAVDPDDY